MADKSALIVLCPVCSELYKVHPKLEIAWALHRIFYCEVCEQESPITADIKKAIYKYLSIPTNERKGDNRE